MKEKIKEKLKEKCNIQKYDVIIFLIVFVIYVIGLLCFFPGLLTSDNVDQINQAMNKMTDLY